jgi:dihydroorotate dehydrogenase
MLYRTLVRPIIFRFSSADTAHQRVIELLRWMDDSRAAQKIVRQFNRQIPQQSVTIGGVELEHPLILAAGFVKGDGFASVEEACAAVESGRNIIPGWRTMPALVGPCEFGSYTPHPRIGNPGTVIWRDIATKSTQNRVGLKNPGVIAAAEFFSRRPLPVQTGINLAVSPGVTDPDVEQQEILDSITAFLDKSVRPAWFTLNLSCPNTEDDPTGNQTEEKVLRLCGAVIDLLGDIPLWVKIGPDLGDEQYRKLMSAFAETGVKAVIATNTLGAPAPDGTMGGIGGGKLHVHAVRVVKILAETGKPVDIIGCGGVMDGQTYLDFIEAGATAVQYWSALVYQGPRAPAIILRDT